MKEESFAADRGPDSNREAELKTVEYLSRYDRNSPRPKLEEKRFRARKRVVEERGR